MHGDYSQIRHEEELPVVDTLGFLKSFVADKRDNEFKTNRCPGDQQKGKVDMILELSEEKDRIHNMKKLEMKQEE